MGILVLYMLYCSFQIVNISVSIKYETNNSCISQVTGADLCALKKHYKLVALLLLAGMFAMLFLQHKISKSSEKN
jgi:hypothetical protein